MPDYLADERRRFAEHRAILAAGRLRPEAASIRAIGEGVTDPGHRGARPGGRRPGDPADRDAATPAAGG